MTQAATELQSKGLQLQFNKVSGDPVQGSIQISGHHKTVSATVQAYSNGVVALSDTLTNTAPRAPTHQMTASQVTHWLMGIIKGLAKT